MDNKKNFLDKLKQLFSPPQTEGENKKLSKFHYLIIVFVIGIAFMLVGNLLTKDEEASSSLPAANFESEEAKEDKEVFKQTKGGDSITIGDYEKEYENQLKDTLETIIGVDDVSVVVNVDASSLKVLEKNRVTQSQVTNETDKGGGERKVEDQSIDEQVVIIRDGENESPIVLQTKKPEIRGVLVVAKGADNVQIKKTIVEAVTRSLGVASHRVAVAPKKMKEDS
ncbi:stage III sporulation protein AG [Metabacillus arenae]|uniref:Stage III sporulation protein AG n=1 Tax=Metabacillus arenae TaxID=2771434 RepID=A0A926RZ82_9BACI|nr:stage III sporulation protein AG [Metabacillus arenae]MBD1378799.1 stage III sporulation protein AG [Metabacillus arenae]